SDAIGQATKRGVSAEAIAVDPGLGFSKTPEQNKLVCDRLAALLSLGRPILVGPSRKRFVGAMIGLDASDRDPGTAAVGALARGRVGCGRGGGGAPVSGARRRRHARGARRRASHRRSLVSLEQLPIAIPTWRDLLEILIVAAVLYRVLKFLAGTRALQILFGLV